MPSSSKALNHGILRVTWQSRVDSSSLWDRHVPIGLFALMKGALGSGPVSLFLSFLLICFCSFEFFPIPPFSHCPFSPLIFSFLATIPE